MKITRIPLEGLKNTRDLGGFPTADGLRVKEGRLIRSGQLCEATEEDLRILTKQCHMVKDIDFRTDREREEYPDPELPGVVYIVNPILREETVGITREKESEGDLLKRLLENTGKGGTDGEGYMEKLYRNLVTDPYSRNQYRNFFRILLENEEGSVLWHCSAGKDRVGVATALLLSALGVPRDLIIQDYLAVNEFTGEAVEGYIQKLSAYVREPEVLAVVRRMMSVEEDYILTVFDMIDQQFGSMELYLEQEMGLGVKERDKLREMYLEG